MSYANAGAVQAAVYDILSGDTALTALVGTAVFDMPPEGTLPDLFVVIGEEVVRPRDSAMVQAAHHDLVVSVVGRTGGFAQAKAAAAAVDAALRGAAPDLPGARLVGLWFQKARARRTEGGGARQIDLSFRAMVESN
ncbi:DUF3168 domain-containing protein [Mesobaculum littorinae]|uniref:DUF3168 domain-containing protein n=1 Tax=Mesobaculum littorinae TaxID=2486419 RepID=A0A438AJW2_9RHOB|nr:DUF3168 domain-containing protein [Mesobaculum littorinae]RVV99000.1 DUF3168 domain-containing protein [Mesobaculum littorinae]